MCLMAMPLSVRFRFLLSCFELDDDEGGVKTEINATLLKCKNLIRTYRVPERHVLSKVVGFWIYDGVITCIQTQTPTPRKCSVLSEYLEIKDMIRNECQEGNSITGHGFESNHNVQCSHPCQRRARLYRLQKEWL